MQRENGKLPEITKEEMKEIDEMLKEAEDIVDEFERKNKEIAVQDDQTHRDKEKP